MRRTVLSILLSLVALFTIVSPALAGTSTDITVTALPEYLSFSSGPTAWTMNGITGSGVLTIDVVYYSNPLGDITAPSTTVLDSECQFTWVNDSSVNIVITANCGAFTGGSADMTNSNSGSNGAATYGAYSWYSGMTYANKVIMKSSGSSILYTTVTPGADKKWGCEIETRTNAWAGGTPSGATMTISAVAA